MVPGGWGGLIPVPVDVWPAVHLAAHLVIQIGSMWSHWISLTTGMIIPLGLDYPWLLYPIENWGIKRWSVAVPPLATLLRWSTLGEDYEKTFVRMAIEQLSTATTHHNAHFFFRTGWINCAQYSQSELHLRVVHFQGLWYAVAHLSGIEPSSARRCIGNWTTRGNREVVSHSHCHSHSHSHCRTVSPPRSTSSSMPLQRRPTDPDWHKTLWRWSCLIDVKYVNILNGLEVEIQKLVYFDGLFRRRDQGDSPRWHNMRKEHQRTLLTEFLAAAQQETGALLSTSDCSPARCICHWAADMSIPQNPWPQPFCCRPAPTARKTPFARRRRWRGMAGPCLPR